LKVGGLIEYSSQLLTADHLLCFHLPLHRLEPLVIILKQLSSFEQLIFLGVVHFFEVINGFFFLDQIETALKLFASGVYVVANVFTVDSVVAQVAHRVFSNVPGRVACGRHESLAHSCR